MLYLYKPFIPDLAIEDIQTTLRQGPLVYAKKGNILFPLKLTVRAKNAEIKTIMIALIPAIVRVFILISKRVEKLVVSVEPCSIKIKTGSINPKNKGIKQIDIASKL